MKKTLVVSNHANHDLEWLKMTYDYGFSPENTVIYDRTPDDFPGKSKIDHLGKVIKYPNIGSNPHDIGRYIVDHYEDLPDIMVHIKGNLLVKPYTTKERFIYGLKANWFVPLVDKNTHIAVEFPYITNNDFFCLPVSWENDNITISSLFSNEDVKRMKIYPRIKTFVEFMKDVFILEDDQIPKFITFAPGANYVVPKNCILKYSKNFYKKILHYTDYNNNPIESHWYERIFQMVWQGCLEENTSYYSELK
jgi:hypothetical protein